MDNRYAFSVFTPTFNRAHTLPRAYASLKAQTWRDFEWVIIDDGSTDHTQDLVQGWLEEGACTIRYIRQPNSGKHVAHNRAVEEARGELFAFLDSDDWYLPNALERFAFHWGSIPDGERAKFAGIDGLCADPQGNVIGTPAPIDCLDSNLIEIRTKYRVKGDKQGFMRTDVLREFPFPEPTGEKFVPEALVWNKLAQKYKTRFVNEVYGYRDYQLDGLSAASARVRVRNPQISRRYYLEYVNLDVNIPFLMAIRHHANYVRFSRHAGNGLFETFRPVRDKHLCLVSYPIGYLLWLSDKKHTR